MSNHADRIVTDDLVKFLEKHVECCVRPSHVKALAVALTEEFIKPIGVVEVQYGVPDSRGERMMEFQDRSNAQSEADLLGRPLHRAFVVPTRAHMTDWEEVGTDD